MFEPVSASTDFRIAPPDAVDFASVKRVLITKLRHHGDVLLASPLPRILKQQFPHLEVDVLVYDDTAPMLANHPDIAQMHMVGRKWRQSGWLQQLLNEWRLLRTLKARRYDVLIHLTDGRRGATLARQLGVKVSVAPKVKKRGWDRHFTHLFAIPRQGNSRHTVEYHLDALRRLGVQPGADRQLVLEPGAIARETIHARLQHAGLVGKPFIHIHPPSRWFFKCWPVEKMSALIDRLTANGWPIVMTGAPTPTERAMNAAIVSKLSRPIHDLTGQLNLQELAALSDEATLFIGVDSAPMHIAAAMQTPVVTFFGPSGDVEWAPWQISHRILKSQHRCRPCGWDGCGGGKLSECLTTISVEEAFKAVQELLVEVGAV
ncbi:putative lipopolysaccharide heptosyltransferase III [Leeia oryzae]|uniref:putative lipopolysaccharide heptosyltransferase III n=1 Tax=Leeia oryzae TaxID=356662 RepID=UPI00035C27BC|nr:putative lipopolysaccharide heptosyltransferase III [Leeia oryzae]